MNWFVLENDDYMFLYENYYLFSYIIDISVDIEPHFYKKIMSKFNVMNFHHLFLQNMYINTYEQHDPQGLCMTPGWKGYFFKW